MPSEDLKKNFLSSREHFTAKRWEGKSIAFKFKYALANYPEMLLATAAFLFIIPPVLIYKSKTFEDSKKDALKKYKAFYKVVRDDDPQIKEIIKEKEKGRHYFPQ